MIFNHRLKKAVIQIEDISCAACVTKIEDSLSKLGGVDNVNIHLATKTAIISYDEDAIKSQKIAEKIKDLGYTPGNIMESAINISEMNELNSNKEAMLYFWKFLVTVFITGLLFFYMDFSQFTKALFSAIAWLYGGWHFHRGFYYSLKNKSADMNTLVSLSVSVMFVYIFFFSFFPEIFRFQGSFFSWHEIPMLLAFLNLGRFLEAKSKNNAADAVSEIFNMFPKFATIIKEDGSFEEIRSSDIKIQDRILIKPGQQVPADGKIVSGFSYFEQAFLTGESGRLAKKEGDFLYAGAMNVSGSVEMIAEKTGSDMMLSKMASLIREGQSAKTNIQKTVDKISAYFVPAVIFIAFFSGFLWLNKGLPYSINAFVSVLAISCPCAMGLSVPLAIMVGFARAVKLGFVINNPLVIENFSGIKTVIMDKTGTLTLGKMSLIKLKSKVISEEVFLKYLLSAESRSEHLFSDAVKLYCADKNITSLKIDNFKSHFGFGIEAVSGNETILVGSFEFMDKNGVDYSADKNEISDLPSSVALLAVNSVYKGYAVFDDPLRENIENVIEDLKSKGMKLVLASGDKKKAVESVAKKLKIEEYYYEIKPDEKHSVVLKHKSMGEKVIMIGDGINDSVAINEADIGVAMKTSSDITSTVSDIILMKDDISLIFKLLTLSAKIRGVIRQNLFWAFSYNALLIPVAAGALYPFNGFLIKPYMAALAMGLSSVSVVFNSLRLMKMKI